MKISLCLALIPALLSPSEAEETPLTVGPEAPAILASPSDIKGQVTQAYSVEKLEPRWLALLADPKTGASSVERGLVDGEVIFESAEKSHQMADGRIILTASDAEARGTAVKLESQLGNQRMGFWTNVEDSVAWKFAFTRWGRYDVELTYSLAGDAANEIEIAVGDQKVGGEIPPTRSWHRYLTSRVGRVYLASEGPKEIVARGVKLRGPAVMNLKAVTLRPAPEGDVIRQSDEGEVVCHAKDAVVHGVKLRYEPAAKKNCLGYWVNVSDWAEWRFQAKPGEYEVEVHQGCGKGAGGSAVDVVLGRQRLSFVVEDTGHFQNFVPRALGKLTIQTDGWQSLQVRPVEKKQVAVMDIREIRLRRVSDRKD